MRIKKLISLVLALLLFLFGVVILLYSSYIKPHNSVGEEKIIEIGKGATSKEIGSILYENKLIKNKDFFVIYLKLNNVNNLQAGTYKLNSNMSLKEIVKILSEGKIYTDETIKITFKEGINYRDLARTIEKNTNNSYDSVLDLLNDQEYIDSLIADYWFLTEDIKNKDIYYSLEGYLFPDTYEFKNKDVTIPEIFKKLLDQMDKVLSNYKIEIENDKYSVHELLTLASIAEKEVSGSENRKKVVSVFINRLNKKMALGSDITTRYSLKLDDKRPLTKSEYNSSNAYNTRNSKMIGLPAGPICMVSKDSIDASIKRIDTNYLYFIANINTNETFFYEKYSEFENKKQELSKVNGGY